MGSDQRGKLPLPAVGHCEWGVIKEGSYLFQLWDIVSGQDALVKEGDQC